MPWHQIEIEEVLEKLQTSKSGLSPEAAGERRAAHGPNAFAKQETDTILERVLNQFKSPLIYILLVAFAFTLLVGEYLDATVIAVALLINVIVGVVQEERAGKAFEKLRESQQSRAIVWRGGEKRNIPTEEVVPGDIVALEAGFSVPADVRILSAKDLKINEAVLTGEWAAVGKRPGQVPSDTALAERENMGWMGTLVANGSGTGVVVATGSQTQVGEIAAALGTIDDAVTPLQLKLQKVATFLTWVISALTVIIFVLGLLRQEPVSEMILIAVAIAVATMPSGLPAAVTVVLAIGMESILKRGGLVRNLLAAETLGSTTVILTDKTGTLTQAKMKLAEIHTYDSLGALDRDHATWSADDRFLLENAVLNSDAFIEEADDAPRKLTVHGRPVEKAIVLGGLEVGLSQREIGERIERIDYLPFSSERKFSASLNTIVKHHQRRMVIAGAPERLLEGAVSYYRGGRKVPMSAEVREEFRQAILDRSTEGMRLIGIAFRDIDGDELPEEDDVSELTGGTTYVGFLALNDPLRDDVSVAINEVHGAGARVIMITGDSVETGRAIARQAGIHTGADLALLGDELEAIEDDRLFDMLMHDIAVIARAAPKHKMRIAKLLRDRGEVVAMTGDGVNDAPALRTANIGVAVGSGTEVAKESADLVLINDSFAIIVAAIEEGRRIVDNLKKIVTFLLSTSFSEIYIMTGALLAGAPLPMLPSQILWGKIVEEGLMSFSFAFEPGDPSAMERDPRSAVAKNILNRKLKTMILTLGTASGLSLVTLFLVLYYVVQVPIEEIRTMMFVAIALDTFSFTFSLKAFDTAVWRIDPYSNRYLFWALLVNLTVLVTALTFPPLMKLLSLETLKLYQVAILVGVALFNLTTIETAKYVLFRRGKDRATPPKPIQPLTQAPEGK
ncbi:HAD-IC family P-type ATPase [Patescibacteria group bacterium]|nr:HAD-IC family P-type ATPase [Patescibacteria group bacterium]